MPFTNQPTPVAVAYVGIGTSLLVEMTDGSLIEFKCDYGSPPQRELETWPWRFLNKEQIRTKLSEHSRRRRLEVNHNLHMDKVRRLGHDYRARGYA